MVACVMMMPQVGGEGGAARRGAPEGCQGGDGRGQRGRDRLPHQSERYGPTTSFDGVRLRLRPRLASAQGATNSLHPQLSAGFSTICVWSLTLIVTPIASLMARGVIETVQLSLLSPQPEGNAVCSVGWLVLRSA